MLDTGLAGAPEVNAVYIVEGQEPALVETGPPADLDSVLAGLDCAGLGPADLAHIVVTHIHLDHAGAAGHLTARFPRSTVWAHERGVPHIVDPTRLVASTARTYGPERMRALFGEPLPVDAGRVRSITDGDTIDLGDRRFRILYTPGHASHHVAIEDGGSGAVFTGEAVGGHVPWAHCYRPSLPPPEVDIEAGLASIERIRATSAPILLTSHFGPVPTEEGCEWGAERIRTWAEAVRVVLATDPGADEGRIEARLRAEAERDLEHDADAHHSRAISSDTTSWARST